MIVKTQYSTGRIDVFDTTNLTDSSVVPKNLLTNWSLNVKSIKGEQTIWMSMSWYEAVSIDETAVYAGLPIARVREGWSFVLVDIDEYPELGRVVIDGRTALIRQGEHLMECVSLDLAEDRAFTVNPKAMETYGYYSASDNAADPKLAHELLCKRLGINESIYETISIAERKSRATEGADSDENSKSLL